MQFLTGLMLVGFGVAILRYRYHIYSFTGDFDWAERYLGGNGTVVAIVLFGMLLIGAGAAFPFGVFDKSNMRNTPNLFVSQNNNTTNPSQK